MVLQRGICFQGFHIVHFFHHQSFQHQQLDSLCRRALSTLATLHGAVDVDVDVGSHGPWMLQPFSLMPHRSYVETYLQLPSTVHGLDSCLPRSTAPPLLEIFTPGDKSPNTHVQPWNSEVTLEPLEQDRSTRIRTASTPGRSKCSSRLESPLREKDRFNRRTKML